MVKSVEEILHKDFSKSLVDKGVHILDPFVRTGNFIIRVMRGIAKIQKSALPYKFEHELQSLLRKKVRRLSDAKLNFKAIHD